MFSRLVYSLAVGSSATALAFVLGCSEAKVETSKAENSSKPAEATPQNAKEHPHADQHQADKADEHQKGDEPKADKEEVKLYLTPGGIYTAADIKANGNMTASQKFSAFKAKHDLKPKAGDKICPITLTKANVECNWIVGGKKYEFCCPPCVDEFVALAKSNPEQIKQPEDYVKH